jgi:hypothetical protein
MTSASEVRDRTAEAWRAFRDAVDDLDLDEPTSAGWSRKEMVSHAAFWLETVQPFVTGMWRGDPSAFGYRFTSGYVSEGDWPEADVHNAREAAWSREQPADVVLARLDAAAITVREFLETVTDDEATAHEQYFREVVEHLDEHRLELLGTS